MSGLLSSYSYGVSRCRLKDIVLFQSVSSKDFKKDESEHFSEVLFASLRGYNFYNREKFNPIRFIKGGSRYEKLKAFNKAKKEIRVDDLFKNQEDKGYSDWSKDKLDYQIQQREGTESNVDQLENKLVLEQVLSDVLENNAELSNRVGVNIKKCLQYALEKGSERAIDSLATVCKADEDLCSAITFIAESFNK